MPGLQCGRRCCPNQADTGHTSVAAWDGRRSTRRRPPPAHRTRSTHRRRPRPAPPAPCLRRLRVCGGRGVAALPLRQMKETRDGSIPSSHLHRSRRGAQPAWDGRRPQGRRAGLFPALDAERDGRARLFPRRQHAGRLLAVAACWPLGREACPRPRRLRRGRRHPRLGRAAALQALRGDDAAGRARGRRLRGRSSLHGHLARGPRLSRGRLQCPLLRQGTGAHRRRPQLPDLRAGGGSAPSG
jgi:hypothetical protein